MRILQLFRIKKIITSILIILHLLIEMKLNFLFKISKPDNIDQILEIENLINALFKRKKESLTF